MAGGPEGVLVLGQAEGELGHVPRHEEEALGIFLLGAQGGEGLQPELIQGEDQLIPLLSDVVDAAPGGIRPEEGL